MDKEILVSEITVTMGKKEIKMTIEEAKKLKVALENLFGKETIKETKTVHEHHYDQWYRQPYYYKYADYTSNPQWTTYCSSGSSTATSGKIGKTTAFNALSMKLS